MSHDTAAHGAHGHDAGSEDTSHIHVVSFKVLLMTLLALLVLTVVTVGAAGQPAFKPIAIWVAMAIAIVKAMLVLLYFMHLRFDSKFNSIAIAAGVLFAMLFIFMCYLDTAEYMPEMDQLGPTLEKVQRGK